jgi:hypothetical protein
MGKSANSSGAMRSCSQQIHTLNTHAHMHLGQSHALLLAGWLPDLATDGWCTKHAARVMDHCVPAAAASEVQQPPDAAAASPVATPCKAIGRSSM